MKVKRNKRSLKGAKKCSKEKKKFKRNKRHEEEFKKKKEVICSQSRPIFRLVLPKIGVC